MDKELTEMMLDYFVLLLWINIGLLFLLLNTKNRLLLCCDLLDITSECSSLEELRQCYFKVTSENQSYIFYCIRFMVNALFFFGFFTFSINSSRFIERGLILGSVVGAVLFNHDNLKEFMFENDIFNNTHL